MPLFNQARFGAHRFGSYLGSATIRVAKLPLGAGGFVAQDRSINGVVVEGIDMLPSSEMLKKLESSVSMFELKAYIQDNLGRWVDFTDRAQVNGRNQLKKIGRISFSADSPQGNIRQRLGNLVMDDSDDFWSRPFPPTLYATYDENWNWLGDQTYQATFSLSQNGYQSVLYRHRIAVRARFRMNESDVASLFTMGVFLIDGVSRDSSTKTVEVRLTSLEFPLVEADANKVKDGYSWYENRPGSFLVKELVRSVYTDTNNLVPATYEIDEVVHYPVPSIDSTGWANVHFGRPPEQTFEVEGAGYETTPEWNKPDGRKSKAIGVHEITSGTLSVTAGSKTVTASSAWTGTISPGDVLTIPREFTSGDGGSSQHFGYYEIESADAGAKTILLTETVRGSTDESSLKWCVNRMFVGVGRDIYFYSQAMDEWYHVAQVPTQGYEVVRIWHNTNDSSYPMYAVALKRSESDGALTYTMQIARFKWNGNATAPTVDYVSYAIPDVMFGEYAQWEPQEITTAPKHRIGCWDMPGIDAEPPLPLLFDQYLTSAYKHDVNIYKNTSYTEAIDSGNMDDTLVIAGPHQGYVGPGYYSMAIQHQTTPDEPSGGVRISLGQDGFLLYMDGWGTNGAILYAKHDRSGGDLVVSSSGYYQWSVKYILLSSMPTSSTDEVTVSMGVDWGLELCNLAVPTCGVSVGTTEFIVGLLFRQTSYYYGHFWYGDQSTGAWKEWDGMVGPNALDQNKIPIELAHINNKTYTVLVDIGDLYGTGVFYEIGAMDKVTQYHGTLGSQFPRKIENQRVRPFGLTHMTIYDTQGAADEEKVFYIESSTGRVRYMDANATPETGPTIAEEHSAMTGETFSLSNVIGSTNTKELYWISSPQPGYTLWDRAEGSFNLSRWGYFVPARVELADFKDRKVWASIGHIAEKVQCLYGFHPDGNFFFKKKPVHSNSVHTFTNVGANQIARIAVDEGFGEIINSAQRTPSRLTTPPMEITWDLSPDSKYDEGDSRHGIEVFHANNESRNIKLVCVEGGRIAERTDDDDSTPKNIEAKFSYEVLDGSIDDSLSVAFNRADGVVYLSTLPEMVYGATITLFGENQEQVQDEDENIDEISGSSRIGYVLRDATQTQMELSEAIDNTTAIIPLQLNGGGTVNLASSLGNGHTLTPGGVLAMGDFSTGTNIEYVQILEVQSEAIVVGRAVNLTRGAPVSHASGEQLALLNMGSAVFLRYGDDLSENYDASFTGFPLFVIGDRVSIENPNTGFISAAATVNPNSTSTELHGNRFFVPIEETFIEVGGSGTAYSTGIHLKFAYGASRDIEPEFHSGDIIRINCPGLKLAKDAGISHSYVDMPSVKKYSKRDSRTGDDNPFINDQEAKWIVRRDVEDNRHPKYTFTVQTVMVPWIRPCDTIYVQSPEVLPNHTEHQELCYVSSVGYAPQTDGLMEVVARAVEPY
jgi:hypothetical protein